MSDNEHLKNENRSRDSAAADGTYRYVRPESKEMLYRDAAVEPAHEAARMPRYYEPPQKNKAPETPKPTPADPGKGFWTKALSMCLVCALLGGIAGSGLTALLLSDRLAPAADTPIQSPEVSPGDDLAGLMVISTPTPDSLLSPGEIYAAACNQVVGITTQVTYSNYFGMTVSQPVSGTGFVISEDGYLLTNYHVIEYAARYGSAPKVITHDGTEYTAVIVGCDEDNDIAVLQIDAGQLNPAPLGNSDGLQVGDPIYAVGNPLGELQFSMTTGSISATDRFISTQAAAPAINMFQIDAAVNQGNSGGPVYDTNGNVVGVVTAKYSDTGIEGLGFAIPINDAVAIATDLITTGYVTGKARLGVEAQTVSARAAIYYNTIEGALLRYIEPGSCAETAGLQVGDVIYRMGDLDVTNRDQLQAAVRSYHAGDTVALGVYRAREYITVIVTLDEDIPETAQTDTSPSPGPVAHSPYGKAPF